jgi:hypothetical protein
VEDGGASAADADSGVSYYAEGASQSVECTHTNALSHTLSRTHTHTNALSHTLSHTQVNDCHVHELVKDLNMTPKQVADAINAAMPQKPDEDLFLQQRIQETRKKEAVAPVSVPVCSEACTAVCGECASLQ